MNTAMILNCLIAPCALLLLALPALFNPEARKWMPLVVLVSLADSIATIVPLMTHALRIPGTHWNWSGKAIDIAAISLVAIALIATRRFTAAEMGYTVRQAPRTGRAFLTVVVPFLLITAFLTLMWFGETKPQSVETLWFEATMPGLAEEPLWRGILLALFMKMFAARNKLLGAEFGYAAIAVSLVFGLVHGLQFDDKLAIHTSPIEGAWATLCGLIFAWLRLRTKSLVLPILTHNATNVILESVPLMH
ncbi:MAG TPA: type II CAAX endopeptidase family protein [Rhizomicrobium sp.]|jgi:hypothetical protein